MSLIKLPKLESTQRFFELFQYYLQLGMICCLAMSFLRFLIYWASLESESNNTALELLDLFWTGFRFDILVIGFWGIPFLIISFGLYLLGHWLKNDVAVLRNYFLVFWVSFSLISFFDLNFFLYRQRHMQWPDHQALDHFQTLFVSFQVLPLETLILSLAIWICVIVIAARGILNSQPRFKYGRYWRSGIALKWLIPLVSVALMARGTVSAHHLELQHSAISNDQKLNEIVLNAAWTLDKNYQR